MASEIDELRQELLATQYWLKVLYGLASPDRASEAHMIRAHIAELKNFSPKENWNPAKFDELALKRLPHIERIGNEIADALEVS